MLYDEYEQKMKKIKSIRHTIYRFRILIISVQVFILALIIGFIATKGLITKDISLNTNIIYGEYLSPDSNALFTGVKYQYRAKGDTNWSYEMPVLPGTYEIRAVSNGSFGKKYSKSQSFTIEKRQSDVFILESVLMYGDNPTIKGSNLIDGDHIECSSFIYDNLGTDYVSIKPDDELISIFNKNNVDVTEAYDINLVSKSIEIIKRPITIRIADIDRVYDGTSTKEDKYEIIKGSLAENDRIDISYYLGLTDFESSINLHIYNNDIDVTKYYDVSIITSNVNFKKRELSIKTSSLEALYDGFKKSNEEYSITSGSLANGDHLSIKEKTSVSDAGTYENKIIFEVFNERGINVSANYDISYDYGTIQINKDKLEITMQSAAKTYDGEPLSSNSYTLNKNLSSMFNIVVSSYNSITYVGSIANKCDNIEILLNNKDVSYNFDIKLNDGLLTIYKKVIELELVNKEKTYDGIALSSNEYVLHSELIDGDTLFITCEGSILDVGQVSNSVSSFEVYNKKNKNVSSSYNLLSIPSTLTITKAPLTVKPKSVSLQYNGLYQSSNIVSLSTPLAVGEKYECNIIGSLKDIGQTTLSVDTFNIYRKDININNNYNIKLETGTLTIIKANLTIKPHNLNIVYDGTPKSPESYDIVSGALGLDSILNVTYDGSITNVGEIKTRIDSFNITANGIDITNNYNVTLEEGIISIFKRDITIKPAYFTKEYDNTLSSLKEIEVTNGSLVSADKVYAQIDYDGIIPGTYLSVISNIYIINKNIDNTSNYNILLDNGSVVITRRNITVSPLDYQKEYDGTLVVPESGYISSGTLVKNDRFEVEFLNGITNVGTASVKPSGVTIFNNNDEDISNYYNVTYGVGLVTVLPREITVKPYDKSKVFDLSALESNEVYLTLGSLANNQTIEAKNSGSITYCGQVVNKINTIKIFDNDHNDVTYNYDITKDDGILEVTKASVEIKPLNLVKIYDGSSVNVKDYEILNDLYLYDFDNVIFNITTSCKEKFYSPLSYENNISSYSVIYNENDITSNFDFILSCGYVTIIKRDITVSSLSATKVYDGTSLVKNEALVSNVAQTDTYSITYSASITYVGSTANICNITLANGSENSTGSYNINYNNGTLEITKRPITVKTGSESFIYDDNAHGVNTYEISSELKLVSGEALSLTYDNEPIYVSTVANTVSNVSILDGSIDRTSNYEIIYDYGNITINKRPISLSIDSASYVYDGTSYKASSYTVTSELDFISSHEVNVIYSGEITNVGEIETSISSINIIKKVEGIDVDVSDNYDVTVINGKITITKRPISIKPVNVNVTYDGELHKADGYEITSGSLVAEHDISYTINSYKYVSDSTDEYWFNNVYIHKFEEDFTSNYEITKDYSKLVISKRKITVNITEATFVYDGKVHSSNAYELSGSLASSDEIVVANSGRIINVGSVTNNLLSATITCNNVDVTENYIILEEANKINVIKRTVEIKPTDITFTYDGGAKGSVVCEAINVDNESKYDILANHILTVTTATYYNSNPIDAIFAASYTNKITGYDIRSSLESELSNYEVIVTDGILKIDPRDITITTASSLKNEYTGAYISNLNYSITSGSLASTDSIIINEYTSEASVGLYDNVLTFYIYNNTVLANGSYNITYEYGKIEIVPKIANIITSSATKVYDGTKLYKYDDISVVGLILGHTYNVSTWSSVTHCGSVDNIVDIKVYDSSSNDVTDNYKFSGTFGKLTITPRELAISTSDLESYYDNTEKFEASYTITNGSLALNDTINITKYTTIVDYIEGGVDNVLEFEILNDKNEDTLALGDYDIKYSYGKLVIKRVEIEISTGSKEFEYDGYIKSYVNFDVTIGALVSGEECYALSFTNGLYAGEYENVIQVGIKKANGNISTDNYIITYSYGLITIKPRVITVCPKEYEIYYDGNYHNVSEGIVTSGSLANSDTMSIESTCNGKYIWNSTNLNTVTSSTIKNNKGIDVTSSYEITYGYSKFTIKALPISISLTDEEKVYDGTPLSSSTIKYSSLNSIFEKDITFDNKYSITYVNESTRLNEIMNLVIKDDDGVNVTSCYDITYGYSALTILQRVITVKPKDSSKVYDGTPLYATEIDYVNGSLELAEMDHAQIETLYSIIYSYQRMSNNQITSIVIYNSDNVDVTENYDIDYKSSGCVGLLTIQPRLITIKPVDFEAEYDQQYHGTNDVQVAEGSLVSGDTLSITTSKKIRYSYQSCTDNLIKSYTILNKNSYQINSCYDVTLLPGSLTINPVKLKIVTGSAIKVYDGTPLTNSDYEFSNIGLLPGDKVTITVTGSQTLVGSSLNTVAISAATSTKFDISGCYIADEEYLGILEVTTDGSENIMKITSSKGGTLYLRMYSSGNYNGKGFDEAIVYNGDINPLTFIAKAYENSKFTSSTVTIEYASARNLIPNYSYSNIGANKNDTMISLGDYDKLTFDTYFYDYLTYSGISLPTSLKEEEANYYSFVLDNYLQINDNLKNELLRILDAKGISSKTPNLINVIKNLVQNYIPYSLSYDPGFDMTDDKALYFFTGASSGICDHYATAATMLYRALGIPARYVVGYKADVMANTMTELDTKVGHAWVEIYKEGLGWVAVEVTGFDDGMSGEENDIITIMPITQIKTYDGLPLTCPKDQIRVSNLPDGYRVVAKDIIGSQTEVGVGYSSITSVIIYDAKGKDVTNKTEFRLKDGMLLVNTIDLVFKTGSATKVYDGTPLTNNVCDLIDGSLLPGHYIKETSNYGQATFVSDGKARNYANVIICDATGTDVTEAYYNLIFDYGELEITKATIGVKTGSDEKVYDGKPLTNSEIELVGTLPSRHTAILKATGVITAIGSIKNTYSIVIKNSTGADVTDNFIINEELGDLIVYEFDQYLESAGKAKTYDGTPLTCEELVKKPNLPKGYTYDVIYTGTITKVGTAPNEFSVIIYDNNHNDITSTFNISYSYGNLTVVKANVVLTIDDNHKEYDGTGIKANSYTITSGEIANGDKLILDYELTSEEIGLYDGKAIYVDAINKDNESVFNCYNVSINNGVLEITKIAIVVYTSSASKEYDGTPLTSSLYSYEGNVISIHILEISPVGSRTDAGTSINDFNAKLYNLLDEELNFYDYYEVLDKSILGELTVTPRHLTITTSSASKVFDGTPLKSLDFSYDSSLLANDDILYGYTMGSITYITTTNSVNNTIIVRIINGSKDNTDNYEIEYIYGELTITPLEITLKSDSATKAYDGLALTCNTGSIVDGVLPEGYTIDYNCLGTITEAGQTDNIFSPNIYDQTATKRNNCFKINKEYGILKIVDQRKNLTVNVFSKTVTYTGDKIALSKNLLYISSDTKANLPSNYRLDASLSANGILVGTYEITIDNLIIYDSNGNDVTRTEFNIDYGTTGYLTIKKRDITVTSDSLKMLYDGNAHSANTYSVTIGSISELNSVEASFTNQIIDIGKKDNIFTLTIYDSTGLNITENCYNITYVYGTLEITDDIVE